MAITFKCFGLNLKYTDATFNWILSQVFMHLNAEFYQVASTCIHFLVRLSLALFVSVQKLDAVYYVCGLL